MAPAPLGLSIFAAFAASCLAASLAPTLDVSSGGCAKAELPADAAFAFASSALLLVADGRPLHSCARGALRCEASLARGTHAVFLYALADDGTAALLATVPAPSAAADGASPGCASADAGDGSAAALAAASALTRGMLYEGWHGPPASALANITAHGGTALSVEDVLRSAGALHLSDIYDKYPGSAAYAAEFFYQAKPASGYYCIYRRRPGEPGVGPDCADISATLARHAAELTAAGVDYVTIDGTNLGSFSAFADWIQLRPGEVVLEEWSALRASGAATPAVAAWQRIPAGGDLYLRWLDLYNNATYAPLVFRDPASGKKLFFVPPGGDAAIIEAIESNGGRNDIVVQQIWALNSLESEGQWSFFAPCTDAAGRYYTTSVVGRGRGATGCGQRTTNPAGPLARVAGSQIAVSPSYQVRPASCVQKTRASPRLALRWSARASRPPASIAERAACEPRLRILSLISASLSISSHQSHRR